MNRLKSKSRSGTILICVLACLGVVTVLVMSMLQSSLRARREVRMQLQLNQTEFLCEAGVQRAVKRLNESPNYQGEKWLPKLGPASFENAAIEIRIEPVRDAANRIRVEVIATLASTAQSNDRMQRSHTFTILPPFSVTEPK